MCREDLRIGRKKFTSVRIVQCAAATNTQIAQQNNSRTHLFIASQNSDSIVGPESANVSTTTGIFLQQLGVPLDFDIEIHGNVVCSPWFAQGSAGTSFVTVIETFFDDKVWP